MVQTARGPVPASELGRTLMHEHVFIVDMEIRHNYPETWGPDEPRIAAAIDKLNQLKALGIDTVVDLTVLGLGRDIPRVRDVAEHTDVKIVVATGVWTLDVISHWFDHRTASSSGGVDPMVDFFVQDLTVGIADTGVKAGILKCAVDEEGLTPANERVLRAVARAHRITGAPISTHTHALTRRGLDQQRVFREEGVDLSRVVIGHSGDTTDLEYLEAIMEPGSVLGMDRFGVNSLLPFEDRVATVVELVRRGYAAQIVLSHDASCYNHHLPDDIVTRSQPDWHHRHIPEAVLPALRDRGVTEEQLDQMLVQNPRRILASTKGVH
jgi:phosphotriesterase-related protein